MELPPLNLQDLHKTSLDDPNWPTLNDYLEEYYQQLGSQGPGLKTYFDKFDKDLKGLRGIVILGGEPGSGKTALLLQIGFDTAADGRPVVIYSFEMPKLQLVTRLFQRAGKIRFETLQDTREHLDQLPQFGVAKQAVSKVADRIIIRETRDFFFYENGEVIEPDKKPVGAINAVFNFGEQIRQLQQITEKFGVPPLVVVDSLHEIPVDLKYSNDLKKKIDYIMLNLRNMCDQTGATFLCISHQSRSGQANGGLQSFLGSASIEYTVDMALTIARPAEGTDDERQLIVHKNRYGPRPTADLRFDRIHMDFSYPEGKNEEDQIINISKVTSKLTGRI